MNILLTGFESWGMNPRNPSGEVALALGGEVLPVRFDAAGNAILRLIRQRKPAAIVMLGLAVNRRTIGLEAVALNVDHHEERRECRWRRRITAGPLALPTRLPIDVLYRRLKRARIPVSISHHAGTFICNHIFYLALRHSRVPCGFIHLPLLSVLPLRKQLRAIEMVVAALED